MPIVSQSDFRANMSKLLDQVEDDCKELIVLPARKRPSVVGYIIEQCEAGKKRCCSCQTRKQRPVGEIDGAGGSW